MKRVFFLAHPEARRRAAQHCMEAPDGQSVTFAEPRKSREQEERYHAMIGDIARQCDLAGRRWDAEDAKRLLISAFREDTKRDPDFADLWEQILPMDMTKGLRGEIVVMGAQSRRFPKKLASAFIEWLYALGTELGVTWSEPGTRRTVQAGKHIADAETGEIMEEA